MLFTGIPEVRRVAAGHDLASARCDDEEVVVLQIRDRTRTLKTCGKVSRSAQDKTGGALDYTGFENEVQTMDCRRGERWKISLVADGIVRRRHFGGTALLTAFAARAAGANDQAEVIMHSGKVTVKDRPSQ